MPFGSTAREGSNGQKIEEFLQATNLKEVILDKHGKENAPNTYLGGSTPIDGIFVSDTLHITKCGYCPFSEGVVGPRADHSCLWLEVEHDNVFGKHKENLVKFNGRKVKSDDPRIAHKFINEYKKYALNTTSTIWYSNWNEQ